MKKKLIPAFLILLFTPSCIFVISETKEHDRDYDRAESEYETEERDND